MAADFCDCDGFLRRGRGTSFGTARRHLLTACLPVDMKNAPPEAVLYPAGNAVAVNYRGSYYEIGRAYDALSRYIDKHGYTPSGYPQEIYLETKADGSVQIDSAHNLTRVIIPI